MNLTYLVLLFIVRLLAQLRDMESAFDGFFEKHHLKLHQYMQLLRYEQSFQEVRNPCMYVFVCLRLHTPLSMETYNTI